MTEARACCYDLWEEGREGPAKSGLNSFLSLHPSLPQEARAQPGKLGVFEEYRDMNVTGASELDPYVCWVYWQLMMAGS